MGREAGLPRGPLRSRLEAEGCLVLDGAMGTRLEQLGQDVSSAAWSAAWGNRKAAESWQALSPGDASATYS